MIRFRKSEALFHYAILIVLVALALATMHTYLRRSIQAKVKDLADHVIYDRQLASLNDPATEKSTRDINSTYSSKKVEGTGGMSSINTTSAYTVQMEHEVESIEKVDYGQAVSGVDDSLGDYLGYGNNSGTQNETENTEDGRGSGGGIVSLSNDNGE